MSQAHVENVAALERLHRALVKFAEETSIALSEAESEVGRTRLWLERELPAHWEAQLRRRHEHLERCKEALRMKLYFKGPSGERQSVADEQKALKKAQADMDEALTKAAASKKAAVEWARHQVLFKGAVQPLNTISTADVPRYIDSLKAMIQTLYQYAAAAPTLTTSSAPISQSAEMTVTPNSNTQGDNKDVGKDVGKEGGKEGGGA